MTEEQCFAKAFRSAAVFDGRCDTRAMVFPGARPVHIAAQNDFVHLLKFLVSHGAYVNAQNNNGNTPMHMAVECVDLLDPISSREVQTATMRNPSRGVPR